MKYVILLLFILNSFPLFSQENGDTIIQQYELEPVLFTEKIGDDFFTVQMNYNIGVTSINKGKLNTITFGSNINDLQTLFETPKSKLNLGISFNSYLNTDTKDASGFLGCAIFGVGANYFYKMFPNDRSIEVSIHPTLLLNTLDDKFEMNYLSFQFESKIPVAIKQKEIFKYGLRVNTKPLLGNASGINYAMASVVLSFNL